MVSPKLDFEPTAPSYDIVVSNDNNRSYNNTNYVNLNAENNILKEEDDYLPSYEQLNKPLPWTKKLKSDFLNIYIVIILINFNYYS